MKKPSKRNEAPMLAAAARASAGPATSSTTTRPEEPAPADQRQAFERGMEAFHARDFEGARRMFATAASGPAREVAHSARLHIRMCEQRLAAAAPVLESSDQLYDYAVTLVNRGEFEAAERHLKRALEQAGEADHLHYALALCRCRLGDLEGAFRHLKRSIELQPRNRALARSDSDFGIFVHRPPLSELLS